MRKYTKAFFLAASAAVILGAAAVFHTGIWYSAGAAAAAESADGTAAADETSAANDPAGETSAPDAAGSAETEAAAAAVSDSGTQAKGEGLSSVTLRCNALLHSTMSTVEDNILAAIPAGTSLDVLRADGIWMEVSWNGMQGYLVEYVTNEAADTADSSRQTSGSGIHTLTDSELADIEANYSTESRGYGASLNTYSDGKSTYALQMQEELSAIPNVHFFGDTTSNTVYLTFSCGWENDGNTAKLLDTLKENGIHAVFFVTHEYASGNPDLSRRMIQEGHEIGNESYSHPDGGIPSLTLAQQMQDTIDLQNYIQDTFGYTMSKYSFPSSEWSMASVAMLSQMGYDVYFYSFNYSDYDVASPLPVDEVTSMLIQGLTPGCIYFLHPVANSNIAALPGFITAAKTSGYTFGQLP